MSLYQTKIAEVYALLGLKSISSLKTLPDALVALSTSAMNPEAGENYSLYLNTLAENSSGSTASVGSPEAQQIFNQSTALFWFLEFVRTFDRHSRKQKALKPKFQKVKPLQIYSLLLSAQQQEIVNAIRHQLRTTDLLQDMMVVKHTTKCVNEQVKGSDARQIFVGSFILRPQRKPVDTVLSELPRGNVLAMLLRLSPRKAKPDTAMTLAGSNFVPAKWAPYSNFHAESAPQPKNQGRMWIARARDEAVVIRYQIPMPHIFTYLAPTKQKTLTARLWQAVAKL